ncbi:MAG: hypothetical protein AAGF86_09185, partial [Pseudomonadota bacterium]
MPTGAFSPTALKIGRETKWSPPADRGVMPRPTTSLSILRAVGEKAPVGMIHFDVHTDLYDGY